MDAVSRFPYIPYDHSAFRADYALFLPWIKAIPTSEGRGHELFQSSNLRT
ncbi:hypothetical protein [Mesorhizobium sp. SARCC-RB16n]|nr:hypothetical protein [Mesorhizobium sp. SARCC-RB16n]